MDQNCTVSTLGLAPSPSYPSSGLARQQCDHEEISDFSVCHHLLHCWNRAWTKPSEIPLDIFSNCMALWPWCPPWPLGMTWEGTHHSKVAGSAVDMQLAQEFLWDGHLVGGCVIRHIQPFYILYQWKLEILLSKQIIAFCKQVSHQLLQKGLGSKEKADWTFRGTRGFPSICFSKLPAHQDFPASPLSYKTSIIW